MGLEEDRQMHLHSLTLNSSCESYCLFSSWFSPLCVREIKRNTFSYNKWCQSLRPTPNLGPFPFVPPLPSLLTALQLFRNQGLTFSCSPDLICCAWLLSSFVLNVTWLSLLVSSCQSYCKRLLRCPSFSLEDRGEQKRNGEQRGVKGQLLSLGKFLGLKLSSFCLMKDSTK